MGIILKTFVLKTSHSEPSINMKLLVIFALVFIGLSSVSVSASKIDVLALKNQEPSVEATMGKGTCPKSSHPHLCEDPFFKAEWCCPKGSICNYEGSRKNRCRRGLIDATI